MSPPPRLRSRRGTSLIEVTLSLIVVSVMLVAALRTVAATAQASTASQERTRGHELIEELLAEIRGRSYGDPEGATEIGLDAGEDAGDRATWDDVDDYHGLAESPPVDRWGAMLPDAAGWQRTVVVDFVRPADMAMSEAADTGLKGIRVSVLRAGRPVARTTVYIARDGGGDGLGMPPLAVDLPEPRARITGTVRRGPAPLSVQFEGGMSLDPRGGGLAMRWTTGAVVASGETFKHDFADPGVHAVTLQVTDELGRVATDTLLVAVEGP